ncbi:hybrid sensor histidine kinase/response regulator transcription factor [Carboxylicivirga linearis]|uniref:histidine kinase n=1 Tax=Carboxylicivirga linearis TaxID=1628157 RepID=A0ABS5JZB0_9BACT|nr:hybrid sensor histidine kinase/response regulator transcription factor [Carboxylicivirga linearis]MBS2099656.1 response regulator [Carboxylicivirga linearis]
MIHLSIIDVILNRKGLISIVFLLLGYASFANILSNIEFVNLNKEYNISIRETYQVCSDDNGFIWISSKTGILRYSQDDIRIYSLPYETGDVITVYLSYKMGQLYAYSNNGQIFKYNSILDKFEVVVNISQMLNNPYLIVYKMLIDQEQTLWVASSSGLLSYSKAAGLKKIISDTTIEYIEWKDETNFFYCQKGVVYTFSLDNRSQKEYCYFPIEINPFVSCIYYNKESSDFWIGTLGNGLFRLNKKDSLNVLKSISSIPDQPILAIEIISDSIVMVGFDGKGVWSLDKSDESVIEIFKEDLDNPNSLKGNGVYDIQVAPNNNVWVCTYSGGASYFSIEKPDINKIAHIINEENSLVNNDVNSLIEDSRGNLWFATNNGISKYSPKKNKWQSFYHDNEEEGQVFLSICEDDYGRIWAGSYSSGVYVIKASTGKEENHYCRQIDGGSFASDFVFDIIKDLNGDIWIGGVRGDLIRYDQSENKFSSFKDVTVNVLYEYSESKLLIGTTYGLIMFDKISGESDVLVDGYIVYDINVNNDNVWLATSGDGIVTYNLNTNDTKLINTEKGLPSNFVNSISYVNGYYWAGTEQGLCRINEEDIQVQTFNSNLNNVSFNRNANYQMKNGNLMYGTNKGVILFNPKQIEPIDQNGRLYIQEIAVSGRSIREIEKLRPNIPLDSLEYLRLPYVNNTIGIELLPVGGSSSGVKYSWILEGLDNDWSKPGNNNVFSYSNIPSGSYRLKIRMYDRSLTYIVNERELLLNITPPYWETWWFKLSVISFVSLLITIFVFYYISRLRKKHSEEKIRFFTNTAHDMRTSLTLISAPIEELRNDESLSAKGKNYLNMASVQAKRLTNVVTRLMDFQKVDIGKESLNLSNVDIVKFVESRIMMFAASAKRRNLEIVFESELKEFDTLIDEIIIEKIIDNLLSNAIKYSYDENIIKVRLLFGNSKWKFEVTDKGIGIEKKAQKQLFKEYYRGDNAINSKIVGSGIGLLLVKNYVLLHGGKITCESYPEQGTTFSINIPILKGAETQTQNYISSSNDSQYKINSEDTDIHIEKVLDVNSSGMKVVVVEDNDYLREFLASALMDTYQVFLAEDGNEGWSVINKHSPDMVVSDIMMPGMDGYDLCKKIKSTYETSHIPVILLTALGGKEQQLQGLGLGADDYLIKPFDVNILRQRINTIIQNRELIKDRALKIIKHSDVDETLLRNELNDKFLKKMVKIARDNISNSTFSKDDFASAMNVSSSLLYKKVKSLTNQSPTDFIKVIRLEYALELIQSRKYTITEVSEMCGFASVGYFSTVFRKHYGKSPTQVN